MRTQTEQIAKNERQSILVHLDLVLANNVNKYIERKKICRSLHLY